MKTKLIADNIERIINCFDDVSREGLKQTPQRVVKFYEEFLNPEEVKYTTFNSEGMDEMIIQNNIPFFSLCEHHLLPFFGIGAIAYIPNGKILGLSKLARTLEYHSRAFQNQERITVQVANTILKELQPKGIGVVLKARHLCMEMRGIKKHDTWTTTSKMYGVFRTDLNCRNEFLNLIK